jgi:[ribosomal protein S18]-alanine N-acetyltransferase
MTTIREYSPADRQQCLAVFMSNCPRFFDPSELKLFEKWLDHQADAASPYQSPTYVNSAKDAYYVIEHPGHGVVGCAGYYIMRDVPEARLAWGMVLGGHHDKGYGTALYSYRKSEIEKHWPAHRITLATSQHTYPFYERMGMKMTSLTSQGFGPELDRYDMSV